MGLLTSANLRGEGRWLGVLSATTLIELLWWWLCWSKGQAPAPFVRMYVALACASSAAGLTLHRVARPGAPTASWPVVALGTVLIALGASLFLPLKYAIPHHVPFYLDTLLIVRERQLLGTDAWQIADSVAGSALPLVDLIYATWLPLQVVVLFSVVVLPPSAAKARALIAYFLAWVVLGVLAATLLASVGPIFHDRLLGGHVFDALTARLRTGAPITWSESEMMWASFAQSRPGTVMGISAMPSLHVAIAIWIWLVSRTLVPCLQRLALIYALVICWASVQLGWHYVSDGVAACLAMHGLWWLSGLLVRPPAASALPQSSASDLPAGDCLGRRRTPRNLSG